MYKLETDRYFFETDIFNFFTEIWPAADIRLATDTDIPKFAYRYFNKVFWYKLVWIARIFDLRQPNLTKQKGHNKT